MARDLLTSHRIPGLVDYIDYETVIIIELYCHNVSFGFSILPLTFFLHIFFLTVKLLTYFEANKDTGALYFILSYFLTPWKNTQCTWGDILLSWSVWAARGNCCCLAAKRSCVQNLDWHLSARSLHVFLVGKMSCCL